MRIVILGAPGVGKGTLAQKLALALDLPVVSTGNLLRQAVKEGSSLGQQVAGILSSGTLVPDKLMSEVVADCLASPQLTTGYILDGFPRTMNQAVYLDSIATLDYVLSLNVAEEVLTARLLGRLVCSACSMSYHEKFAQPRQCMICDSCGAELKKRNDDRPEVTITRFRQYNEQTAPLIEYYQQRNLLLPIDATMGPAEILEQTLASLYLPKPS